MIWPIVSLSGLFTVIAFTLTTNNAKYLLAGYNTMSPAEREKVDIKRYIPFFRIFHLFLGISLLAIGLLLNWLIGEGAAGAFLASYPIVAYVFFVWKSKNYYKGEGWKANKIAIFVLAIVLVAVLLLMYLGFQEDKFVVKEHGVEIQGIYGEELSENEIQRIEIVYELPEISLKVNGFAMRNTYKGYFKTKENGVVKLILNEEKGPYLLIKKASGKRIYYSSGNLDERELYEKLKEKLQGADSW